MTPAEHYARAEFILEQSKELWETEVKPVMDNGANMAQASAIIAAFQVRATSALAHATLALAKP